MLNKYALRKKILEIRKDLTAKYVNNAKLNLLNRLIEHPKFLSSSKIGIYWPINNELDPTLIIDNDKHKEIFLPIVEDNFKLKFSRVRKDTKLIKNKYGIYEPFGEKKCSTNELDLIFLPSVAVDKSNNRLGSGSGYYDRNLMQIDNTYLIALAYQFQVVPEIPIEKHDIKCDDIIVI